ncbi:MAG: hypothetical protein WBZ36_27370 [Candidatus Nitrosopolaris sp.]
MRFRGRDWDVQVDLLTEFSSVALNTTNIIEKMIKMTVFQEGEVSTPLYEEKSTMLESITATTVKPNMKIKGLSLLSDKLG